MANVYAVKTGNWSDTTVWNTGALPTSADDVYSNTYTVTIDQDITVLSIRNTAATDITIGGTYILNGGVTVTTTTGVVAGNTTCLTYSAAGISTINGSINAPNSQPSTYTYALVHNGPGTLNINGNLNPGGSCSNRGCLSFTGSGVINVVGNNFGGFCNSPNVNVNSTGTMNIIGNIQGGSNTTALNISGSSTVNITGNIGGGANTGRGVAIVGGNSVVTVTGNIVEGAGQGQAIFITAGNLTVIGNIGNNLHTGSQILLNAGSSNCYIKVIGTIFSASGANLVSTGTSAINVLSGPFICSPTGIMPINVVRMHYFRTIGSYFEFRDETTNGALPPAAPAPATRLVSPDTLVDAPIPADVRDGVSYSLGTFTGTLKVPSPNSVSFGVPTDDTFGTAALRPEDVWNAQTSAMNTEGSIGKRLKNASTVDSTGDQLSSLL